MYKYRKFIESNIGLSYNDFFQLSNKPNQDNNKQTKTFYSIIEEYFPIMDENKKACISYCGHSITIPEYDWDTYSSQCLSYVAKLQLKFCITIKDIKQHHHLNIDYIPIMLESNTFMINGIKKVMVCQLTKTGGIYYDEDDGRIRLARLVATNGSRIEIKVNQRDIINIYVNISKKIMIEDFFSLISVDKIIRYLNHYRPDTVHIYKKSKNNELKNIIIFTECFEFIQISSIEIKIAIKENIDIKDFILTSGSIKQQEDGWIIQIADLYSIFLYLSKKTIITNKKGNETLIQDFIIVNESNRNKIFAGQKLTGQIFLFKKTMATIYKSFCKSNDISDINDTPASEEEDKNIEDISSEEENATTEENKFDDQYEDNEESDSLSIFYAIDSVVRKRINTILNIQYSKESTQFTEEDIINFLIHFESVVNHSSDKIENYDLLIYKRVKKPESFVSSIILRKIQKLRNSIKTILFNKNTKVNIDEILNSHVVTNDIRKIFNSHPLVQFLDQTNPLAEISHRRRISVFNLNNIERYQISFEGRDINPTYFNRICPIQTPEGANIGLINTLSIYAQIDEYGFISAPYYKVNNGKVNTEQIVWLPPTEDYNSKIYYYNTKFETLKRVTVKYRDTFITVNREEVDYITLDNYSMLSLAAASIPFIMNDDARRALMGANMQRQATPLLNTDSPIVGTGIEAHISRTSNMSTYTTEECKLYYGCAAYILLQQNIGLNSKIRFHMIDKYQKTNMKTCINSKVRIACKAGTLLKPNTLLYEKGCSEDGELAIGSNLLVAFMIKDGYSFEDSIVISDKVVKYGLLDTIHMNDIDLKAKEIDVDIIEKFTKDNPNNYIANLQYLDKKGIVKVGVKIKPSQVIASRVVPMDTNISNEDSILSLIFGKHLSNFKDISCKANYDISGVVIDVKYFNRYNQNESDYYSHTKHRLNALLTQAVKFILDTIAQHYKLSIDIDKYIKQITTENYDKISSIIDMFIEENNIDSNEVATFIQDNMETIKTFIIKKIALCNSNKCISVEHNIIEYVRILIAEKRSISIGDKLSGRHGNKGVVSYICPEVDMPFMSDGTTIDVLLNPIGIPNRLNIGQVLETQLGLTSFLLQKKVKCLIKANNTKQAKDTITEYLKYNIHRNKNLNINDVISMSMKGKYVKLEAPVFQSISTDDMNKILKMLSHHDNGMFRLRDGISGKYLIRKVKVAPKYIMKLNHMAKDKLAARETGGYSTILQQPLPRKLRCGGQRCGEMEVWAFASYGCSIILRETLGPRSDDRKARNLMYEWIFSRKYKYISHLCETVNVIVRYLNGAGIMLDFKKKVKKIK